MATPILSHEDRNTLLQNEQTDDFSTFQASDELTETGENSLGLTEQGNEKLAQALGWFSLALGAAELFAPNGTARLIGVRPKPNLFRILGVREIASGIGILTSGRKPAAAMWSRVAGDAMDLSLLGAAFASPDSEKGKLAAATIAVAGVTALDVICSQNLSRS